MDWWVNLIIHSRPTHTSHTRSATATRLYRQMEKLLEELVTYLLKNDWDVIGCHSTDSYNQRLILLHKQQRLHSLPSNKYILCVGNSKRLWKRAKELLAQQIPHPFDQILTPEAVQHCSQICQNYGITCTSFNSFSFEPFLISFQDLAVTTGIGVYSEDMKLVIHPIFGPWFALRFALILDADWNPQQSLPGRLPIASSFSLENVNFENVKSLLSDGLVGDRYDPYRHIAARRSIPIGLEEAYSDEQIAYHYHLESYSSSSSESSNQQTSLEEKISLT